MTITQEAYLRYKKNNDHSWYKGRLFVDYMGNVFKIRNVDYKKDRYEYKYWHGDYGTGNGRWATRWIAMPLSINLNFLVCSCNYYYKTDRLKRLAGIESALLKMRERF